MAQAFSSGWKRGMESYSAADRAIANFILTNRGTLAFETAASVAQKLGLSKVTVAASSASSAISTSRR